jgi:hypothetical protein
VTLPTEVGLIAAPHQPPSPFFFFFPEDGGFLDHHHPFNPALRAEGLLAFVFLQQIFARALISLAG